MAKKTKKAVKKVKTVAKKKKTTKAKVKLAATTIVNGFLLDSSGSMSSVEDVVISGFNEQLKATREAAKKAKITNLEFISFFGAEYKEHPTEINKLVRGPSGSDKGDNNVGYSSDLGMTALWESAAKLVWKLEALERANPNCRVTMTIFTDGYENASSFEWRDGSKIKEYFKEKTKQGWVINMIGAGTDQEVKKMSGSVGISASNTMSYTAGSQGTSRSMGAFSQAKAFYVQSVATNTDSNIGFFSNANTTKTTKTKAKAKK